MCNRVYLLFYQHRVCIFINVYKKLNIFCAAFGIDKINSIQIAVMNAKRIKVVSMTAQMKDLITMQVFVDVDIKLSKSSDAYFNDKVYG